MSSMVDDIASIVELSGGQLVGRTRLQKAGYFLEAFGAGFGFQYDYYHYGPYSEELSDAARDAVALGLVDLEWKFSQSGAEYAIYSSRSRTVEADARNLRRKSIVDVVNRYDSITVELAATADYLAKNGYEVDPWGEVQVRKAKKFTLERQQDALRLLSELRQVAS